jgi:heptose II phosphotransferase
MPPTQGLKRARIDGFRVQWKDDGVDYPAIWRAFREGRLPGLQRLHTNCPDRLVFRLETEKGPLVLKKDWEQDLRPEKKLWRFLGGPWYSRLIRLTNRAVNRGCDVVQDVYLAAEKMKGRFAAESWLIAEFVEGAVASGAPDYTDYFPEMGRAMGKLHDYGLASNDAHGANFIITENKAINIIDLSLTSPIIICQANDILKVKRSYGVDVPARGLWRKLASALVNYKHKRREARRRG